MRNNSSLLPRREEGGCCSEPPRILRAQARRLESAKEIVSLKIPAPFPTSGAGGPPRGAESVSYAERHSINACDVEWILELFIVAPPSAAPLVLPSPTSSGPPAQSQRRQSMQAIGAMTNPGLSRKQSVRSLAPSTPAKALGSGESLGFTISNRSNRTITASYKMIIKNQSNGDNLVFEDPDGVLRFTPRDSPDSTWGCDELLSLHRLHSITGLCVRGIMHLSVEIKRYYTIDEVNEKVKMNTKIPVYRRRVLDHHDGSATIASRLPGSKASELARLDDLVSRRLGAMTLLAPSRHPGRRASVTSTYVHMHDRHHDDADTDHHVADTDAGAVVRGSVAVHEQSIT